MGLTGADIVIFIISFIIGAAIVNGIQRLYMKLTGAAVMFYDGKKKVFAIFLVGSLVFGLMYKIFH